MASEKAVQIKKPEPPSADDSRAIGKLVLEHEARIAALEGKSGEQESTSEDTATSGDTH